MPLDAIRFEGDIIVSEFQSGSVLRISGPGEGDREVLASGFEAPASLAADGGSLWVTEHGTGSILELATDG